MMFVYVHDGHGERVEVVRQLPIVLGRSASCDVRLDRPTISPRHARLELGPAGPRLVDLDSLNGLYAGGSKVAEVLIGEGISIHLGDVRLDVTPHERLAPTRPHGRPDNPRRQVALSTLGLVACYVGLLSAMAFQQFAEYWPPERSVDLFAHAMWLWLAVLGTSTLLSLFSKVQNRRYRFTRFASVLSVLLAAIYVLGQVMDTLVYNARLPVLRTIVEHGSVLIVLACGLWALIATLYPDWRRRRQVWSAIVTAVVFDVAATTYDFYEYREGDRQVHDEAVAFPVLPPTLAAGPTAALLDDLEASRKAVDGHRTERQAELKLEDGPVAPADNH